jgi:hypothetical protein
MPTLAPRKKTAPGRDSLSELVMVAASFMKPRRSPKRSIAWMWMARRTYGDLWNS